MPTSKTVRSTSFSVRGKHVVLAGLENEYIFGLVSRDGNFYENDLLDIIASLHFSSDGLIVDVGANIGNHTVYFGSFFENPVLAIEPVTINYELLQRNIVENSLNERVSTVQCVVWDKESDFEMINNIPENGGTFQAIESGKQPHSIEGRTLTDIVGDRPVALLKIDVEGAENKVVEGGLSVIARDKPTIVAESHSPEAYRGLSDLLVPMGYEVVAEGGRSVNYVWVHPESMQFESVAQLRHRLEIDARRHDSRRTLTSLDRISNKVGNLAPVNNEDSGRHQDVLKAVEGMAGDLSKTALQLDSLSEIRESTTSLAQRAAKILTTTSSIADHLESSRTQIVDATRDTSELVISTGSKIEKFLEHGIATLSDKNAENQRATADINDSVLSLRGTALEVLAASQGTSEAVSRVGSQLTDSIQQGVAKLSEGNDHRLLASTAAYDRACAVIERAREAIEKAVETTLERQVSRAEQDLADRLATAVEELDKALDDREKFETAAVSWHRAFKNLAERWESNQPEALSAKAAVNAVREVILARGGSQLVESESANSLRMREVQGSGYRRTDSVRIGIATMPGRERGLKAVLEALLPQADEIFVYLNGADIPPSDIAHDSRVRFFTGPDYGDRGKFLFIEGFDGYYLTCDDDIEYPDFYVDYMIDGIERYGRKAIVGWHGSIFSDDFEDYYNSKYRRVLSFSTLRGKDTPVHLLGTGIAGFHTSTMPVEFEDFHYPNMADAFLARKAQWNNVPMVVLRHEKGWAIPIEADAPSISNVSLGKGDPVAKFDVRAHVSKLVKDHGAWKINELKPELARDDLGVAVIGRTDKAKWKKGGILKSCHITASLLQQFGANVVLADIETGDPENLGGAQVSVVMIYVGDPERPDFARVEHLVELHAGRGRVVVINLSVNGKSSRNRHIRQKLLEWEAKYGNRVVLMVFTEAMLQHPELDDVEHLLVPIPKTLSLPLPPAAEFHTSDGIFVGDIAKLSDSSLMSHPAEEWIKAIRSALPEAPIHAVRQYKPKYDVPLDVDEIWPFLRDDFSERISSMRLMVTPIKYATFEMVPVEVASLGVPVIYQQMPQSLSEYLGLAGVQVRTPEELELVLPILYRDPSVWRSQSRAGKFRAKSSDLRSSAGQMYMRIAMLAKRAVLVH
ncbi:FkbM family methyltransferase [Pseudarthrobacter raffinosi]|uniref:FkbM family methyltransferase n=1 Tax=Pseudarthrobacter raffinosi TaxID=2953651 RepID=UPI00208F8CBB|nr:FkbM family methyltransferase [Pseudarthrobacter sp. MDT3-28]MCO4238786.1 FkbM family methyltransferase [Pseudarthrobacter sp. MDT3-28]